MSPKAFICHASEDKERFVVPFAETLRSFGIDAWVDAWELAPGDSLADRIFDEGIKQADAFVIVMSANSVDKKWVLDELNAAMIHRLEGKTKVIPVLIEECEVPKSLHSMVWEKIINFDALDSHATKIANLIFGISDKPALGSPPKYVELRVDVFGELEKQDGLVLEKACEMALREVPGVVDYAELRSEMCELGLQPSEVKDSVEVIDSLGFVRTDRAVSIGIMNVRVEISALEQFLRQTDANYESKVREVCLQYLNYGRSNLEEIVENSSVPERLVRHVLKYLDEQGLAKVSSGVGKWMRINSFSPQLIRQLRSNAGASASDCM